MKALSKYRFENFSDISKVREAQKNGLLRKRNRIFVSLLLSACYAHFSKMERYRSVLNKEGSNTYDEAEKMSDSFNSIFNLESKPSDFLYYEDETCDKVIYEYRLYKKAKSLITRFGYDEQDVEAFCHKIEFSYVKGLVYFKIQSTTHYEMYSDAAISYLVGMKNYSDMAGRFVKINLLSKSFVPLERKDVIRYIKDLSKAYETFQSIATIRLYRKFKRENDPWKSRKMEKYWF